MPAFLLRRFGLNLSHSLSLSLGLRFPPGFFLQGALSFLGLFDPMFNFPGFVFPPGLLTESAFESSSELFCLGEMEASAQFLR